MHLFVASMGAWADTEALAGGRKTPSMVNLCICKPKAPDCGPSPAGTTKIPLKKILTF